LKLYLPSTVSNLKNLNEIFSVLLEVLGHDKEKRYLILFQNNNVIGQYESYELCSDFVKSVESLGVASNFKIVKYKKNSCIKEWVRDFNNNQDEVINQTFISNDFNRYSDNKKDQKTDTKEIKKKKKLQAKESQKEQYNINLLKSQREKIIESKNKYEVDMKLYNQFKENKVKDENFVVPDIFEVKYKIFEKLDNNDELSWDNFASEFKETDFNGRFSNIFEISNEFDQKFCKTLNIESSESSESDSDSDSDVEETSEYSNESGTDDGIVEVFSSEGTN